VSSQPFAWKLAAPCWRSVSGRFCFLICLLVSSAAFADNWTNAAGHGIEAELVDGDRHTVVLRTSEGRTVRMAMKSLCTSDQVRARKRLKIPGPPTAADRKRTERAALVTRAERLYKAGKLTEAELHRIRRSLDTPD